MGIAIVQVFNSQIRIPANTDSGRHDIPLCSSRIKMYPRYYNSYNYMRAGGCVGTYSNCLLRPVSGSATMSGASILRLRPMLPVLPATRCQVYLASISRAEVTVAQSHSCQLVTTIAHWHCTGLTKLESITRTTGTLVNDANRPDYINSLSVQVQRRVEFVAFGDPNL